MLTYYSICFCIVGILHFMLCVSENVFNWDIYLRKQEAVAAPTECFVQVCKALLLLLCLPL